MAGHSRSEILRAKRQSRTDKRMSRTTGGQAGMPVLHPLRKIFAPTATHLFSNVIADNQFSGKAGFDARVDNDRSAVSEMVAHDFCLGGINIAGGFKARPG